MTKLVGEMTKCRANVLLDTGSKLPFQPLLEVVNSRLRDNDALGSFEGEICRKTTTKPHRDILHCLARDDKLAICAEEIIAR